MWMDIFVVIDKCEDRKREKGRERKIERERIIFE